MTMRMRALLTSLCAAAVVSVAAGCSDDEDTNPTVNPLVGTWNATSVMTPSGDVVSNGMGMTVVVGSSGSISLAITGDQMGLCAPGPDCTVTGTWTSTDNTITILS